MIRLLESASGADRLRAATDFLAAVPPGSEVLVVGASRAAVDDLVRGLASQHSRDLRPAPLHPHPARRPPGRAGTGGARSGDLHSAGAEALAARATFAALAADAIPFFAPVARCPGFGRTLAATLADLRAAGVGPRSSPRPPAPLPELGASARRLRSRARRGAPRRPGRAAALRDRSARRSPAPIRSSRCRCCSSTLRSRAASSASWSRRCAAAPRVLITSGGDRCARGRSRPPATDRPSPAATSATVRPPGRTAAASASDCRACARLADAYLFNETEDRPPARRTTTRCASSPPRARDARRSRSRAGSCRRRAPGRRSTTWWSSCAARRPTPRCSRPPSAAPACRPTSRAARAGPTRPAAPSSPSSPARRTVCPPSASPSISPFGQVPQSVSPMAGRPRERAVWTGPRDEALGAAAAAAADAADAAQATDGDRSDEDVSDALRAPWKWEELLVDAAVIGGAERWQRRLSGLAHELQARARRAGGRGRRLARASLAIERELDDLGHLRRFASAGDRAARRPARRGDVGRVAGAAHRARTARPAPPRSRCSRCSPSSRRWLRSARSGSTRCATCSPSASPSSTDEPPQYRYGRVLVATPGRRARPHVRRSSSSPVSPSASFRSGRAKTPCCSTRRARGLCSRAGHAGGPRRPRAAAAAPRGRRRRAPCLPLVPARRRRAGAPARHLLLRARRRARDAGRHPRRRGVRARRRVAGRRPPRLAGAARSRTRHRRGRARPGDAGGAHARARRRAR